MSGFDTERFRTSVDDFICAICCGVLNVPRQTPCGHVFCEACISGWLANNPVSPCSCPVCKVHISRAQLVKPLFAFTNLLNSLKIKCSFDGCEDSTITLEKIANHELQCGFAQVLCPHPSCPFAKSDANPYLTRSEMERHVATCEWRAAICPNKCGQAVLFRDLRTHRDKVCAFEVVLCESGCGLETPRGQMVQHITGTCTKTVIKCELCTGCDFHAERGAKVEWNKHLTENLGQHFLPLLKTVKQQDETIRHLKDKLHVLQIANPATLKLQRTTDWVLWGITSRSWDKGFFENSPELCFHSIPDPRFRYSFKIRVDANCCISTNCVGIYFLPQKGPNPSTLSWPIANQISVSVLSMQGEQKSKLFVLDGSGGTREFFHGMNPVPDDNKECRGWSSFLTREEVESGMFTHNDALVIRVGLLEQPFI
eukprot:c15112_g1_i1.p1 GENE.c15112_g1_i1~~c15112_g1_i1.p1  ORF type:complete len:441 (+),score=64.94 c15112_g1_i1:48-1325(+)